MKKKVSGIASVLPGMWAYFIMFRGYEIFREPFSMDSLLMVAATLFFSLILHVAIHVAPALMAEDGKIGAWHMLVGEIAIIYLVTGFFIKQG